MPTITVNTVVDELDGSIVDGDISLRDAIAVANATAEDTIDFDASVFTGGENSVIRLTIGELEITDSLTIDASTTAGVTLSGDANGDDVVVAENGFTDVAATLASELAGNDGLDNDGDGLIDGADLDGENLLDDNTRVLHFSSTNGDLTLIGLAVTGGRSITDFGGFGSGIRFHSNDVLTLLDSKVSGNSTAGQFGQGAGIWSYRGDLTLINSRVSGNSTSGFRAGGAGIRASPGNVSLIRSTVTDNSTSGDAAYGGGIYHDVGQVVLTDSTVSGNSTSGDSAHGGGIRTSSSMVSLIDSSVSYNSAIGVTARGGGIAILDGAVTLTDSRVSGNSADFLGGGISTSFGTLTVTNSTVSGNSILAFGGGGGIHSSSGTVTLTGSTVSGNSATVNDYLGLGGGIYASAAVSISDSTISNNNSGEAGGGIMIQGGPVTLTNSTVTGNRTGNVGGGVYVISSSLDRNFTLDNTIVAGNTDGSIAPDLRPDPGSIISINHSLIGATELTISGTGNQIGTLTDPIDPLLSTLSYNGGATKTHALLPGSSAWNAGSSMSTVDQRGLDRDDGLGVDIGAYEAQVAPTADFDTDGDVDGADFLRWQRGFGKPNAQLADGNSDDDLDVDASDFRAWQVSYGKAVEPLDRDQEAMGSEGVIDAALAAFWVNRNEHETLDRVDKPDIVESEVLLNVEQEIAISPTNDDAKEKLTKSVFEDPTTETILHLADELLERTFD